MKVPHLCMLILRVDEFRLVDTSKSSLRSLSYGGKVYSLLQRHDIRKCRLINAKRLEKL